jgi:SPP1 gp7 family putative phage head morphogenesis protein
MQKIQGNLSDFAAFKQYTLSTELQKLRTNADGTLTPKADYGAAAQKAISRHNRYLRVELTTATQAAQAAEAWQEFERRAHLYPNLIYHTAHDERVRDEHRPLDQVIRALTDSFWDIYYPPNGWHCRCKCTQTDKPITAVPSELTEPAKGFRQNVGKTGKIFHDEGEMHPYFNVVDKKKTEIERQANRFHGKLTRPEIRDYARKELINNNFSLPDLPHTVVPSMNDIKAFVSHYHPNEATRNEMLYDIENILRQATFIGSAPNNPDKLKMAHVKMWYYYHILINEENYYINLYQAQRTVEGKVKEWIGLYTATAVEYSAM